MIVRKVQLGGKKEKKKKSFLALSFSHKCFWKA